MVLVTLVAFGLLFYLSFLAQRFSVDDRQDAGTASTEQPSVPVALRGALRQVAFAALALAPLVLLAFVARR